MDFHAMKRKELQELCKKHGVPANMKSIQMANTLTSIFKEKEKEQITFKGKSCLKILDENSSDDPKKLAKKVQFSPQNEMFEFNLGNDRAERIKLREMKKRSVMKMDQKVETKVSEEVADDGVKMTRSRAKKSMVGDVAVDISCPKTKKNAKSREKDVNDVVKMDNKVDVRAAGGKRSKRSADETLAGESVKFETRKVLRQSIRNVTKDNNLVRLKGETGDADTEFEAGGRTTIDPGVVVNEEHEMIVQPTRAIGRKSLRQKAAVTFIEPENKTTASVHKGDKMVEHIEAPNENEKGLVPTRTLRRSRRQTTLFKPNASVNVGLETTEDVQGNKPTKISRKSLSFERTLVTTEFPRRSTRNSCKHGSVEHSNDTIGNYKNESRKRARREPKIPKKVQVVEAVTGQVTISAPQALSADVIAESELDFNMHGNSTIIDDPTNAIIDEELQGGIQINGGNIKQSNMLIETGQLCVEREQSSGHDSEVPIDTMCGNEIFRYVGDEVNSRETSEEDVELNALETDLTLNEDITTEATGIKLGCEIELVLMDPGCQVVDYTESGSPERITDNVPEDVKKESMHDVSCGQGISPTNTTTVRASGITEDIPASVHSISTDIEENEDEDLASSDFSVSYTGRSSVKQIELTDTTAQMIVGSLSPKETQGVVKEGDNTFIPSVGRPLPTIDANRTAARSAKEIDEYVNEEPKESQVLEASNEKGSEMCELSVDLGANPLLSQERDYRRAHNVEDSRELKKIHCELFAKTAAVDDMAPEISQCCGEDPLFTPIPHSDYTGMDDLEVPASHTNSSVREVAMYPEPTRGVLDECTYESSHKEDQGTSKRPDLKEEKLSECEVGEGNLNETVEVYLSPTVCKVLVGERLFETENASISFNKVPSYQNRNDITADIKEENKVDFGSPKSTSSPDEKLNESNTTEHVLLKMYDHAKDECNEGGCAAEFCKAELGDDGDFHNGDVQVSRNTRSNSEETVSKGMKFFEEKTSVEMIQTTFSCPKDIDIMEEEENSKTSQNTSPFTHYDATYDYKVRKEARMEDFAVELCDNVREREAERWLETEFSVDGASHNVVAQVNGSVSSNWEETIGKRNDGYENDISPERNLNTSACIKTIDMSMEEESGGTSPPVDRGPDLLVSDYGDEHANMYVNGYSSSSDSLPSEASDDSSGDNLKEKSDLDYVKSISEGYESTYLMTDTENNAIQQHHEMMSTDHTVQESEESHTLSSYELMPAKIEVKDRKENFEILEGEFEFGHDKEVVVAAQFYASSENTDTDVGNHIEEVKAGEMHENSKDDHIYEQAEEKSDFVVVKSIFVCNQTTDLLTGLENATTCESDKSMTISLADRKDTMVHEAHEGNSIASNEMLPIPAEVRDRKETFRKIEVEVDIGDENAGGGVMAVLDVFSPSDEMGAENLIEDLKLAEVHQSNHHDEYILEKSENVEVEAPTGIVYTSWTSEENIETESGNHVEGVKVAEPQSSKDGDIYEKAQTVEEITHVTILRKMGMDVDTSDYAVESIFECNPSTHFLTDLENDTTDQHDKLMLISLGDHKYNKVEDADERNPLGKKEAMPLSVEVGEGTETFTKNEGEVNVGDENAGGGVVPVELNASSQNNEMCADNDMEELNFAEALLSYRVDCTVEKTETVGDEAPIETVKDVEIVDASSDVEPDTSHVTAASSLSSCKVSIDVNTPFKGDDDVTLENKSLQDDHVNVMSTTYAYLLEEVHCKRETSIVEDINEEAHGSSCFAKEMEEESVELAVSDYVVYDITMKPELKVACFATSPVIPSAIHDNGTVELQVESSPLFRSREINLFLESEENESKPLTPSKALNEDSHYMEQKLTELNNIERVSLDEPIFERVQSLRGDDAIIAKEKSFDHKDRMEQTVAIDTLYDNDAFVKPSFEQVDSLKKNGAEEQLHEHGHHVEGKVTESNGTDRDSLEGPISEQAKSVKENDTIIATEECSDHEDRIEQRVAINSSFDHAALGLPMFEQIESFMENATALTIEECSKGDDNMDQTVAIENSFAHAASNDLVAETDCMDTKRSKHGAGPMEAAFSFSAKPLSSSIIEVKKSRSKPIQRTPAKEMMWTADMKENTPMIKTEQTAIVKQSTKRRALEDIQKI